jgi:hypothetical protein
MSPTSMSITTGMKTASGTPTTTKMSSTKRRSTKVAAIASAPQSKDPIFSIQRTARLVLFLGVCGPSVYRRRATTKGATTKFSMVTTTLFGSETNSLPISISPL